VTDLDSVHRELGIPLDYAASRGLSLQPEPAEVLVTVAVGDARPVQLIPPAAEAWRRMVDRAASDSITLIPLSGFRSTSRQTEIIRAKLKRGHTIAEILKINAAPGFSEHHTGRAIDIGTVDSPPLEEHFAATPAFRWLIENAGRFGFSLSYPANNPHGMAYEPWHWLWRA
jgi:D-alanyl-D-alanine carboxypeptidase